MSDATRLRVLYVRSRPLVQYVKPDGNGKPVACEPNEEGAVVVPVRPLDDRLEFDKLVEILDSSNLPIRLHLLPHATAEDFVLELTKGYDVVYFDGHGEGLALAFEDPYGTCHNLPVAKVAEAFDGTAAKLVVLSACESSGLLVALVQTGVPAAIGMTDMVGQDTAASYARGLFTGLTQGKTVAQAHGLGLKLVGNKPVRAKEDKALPRLLPSDSDITLAEPGLSGKLERTGAGAPTNIFLPDKPFVGRGEMIVEVNRALESNRIVVLEGEGGIGKTALAQHVAVWQAERNKCPGGAAFVSFDPPLSRDLTIDAIGVALFGSDFSKAQGNHLAIVKEHFTKHQGLVVLDNFESVRADPEIHALVQALSPHARILVTTREHMSIGQTIRVKELDDTFAVMLFVVLARQTERDVTDQLDAVQAICRELGNMPLAIELVAPQAATLSLHTVLDRVKQSLSAVTADRPDLPPRQCSLIASLDLSYDSLSEPAKLLFRRLSVFASGAMGFRLPDVCDVKDWENPIAELVRHGLVRFEDDRYSMLPPVRRYAAGKLAEAGEKDRSEERFGGYFAGLAQQVHEQMDTKEGAQWVAAAGNERDNLLAAQRWFLERNKWNEATGMADLLDEPFDRAGFWTARRDLHAPLRKYAETRGDKPALAVALAQLAKVAHRQGDLAEAHRLFDESLAIYRELCDKTGIARTLGQLAILAQDQGNYDDAKAVYEEIRAMFEELHDKSSIASTLMQLGSLSYLQGDLRDAEQKYKEGRALSEELDDKPSVATALHQLGMLARDQGDYAEAGKLFSQNLAIEHELGDKSGIASTLHQIANLAYQQDDLAKARELYNQSLAIARDLGDKSDIASTLHQLGMLAQDQGDLAEAGKLYDESLAIERELGDKSGVAETTAQLGQLAEAEKDDRTALKDYIVALAIFEMLKSPYRDFAKEDIARMQQRLGDEAFRKLHDEVVAELSKEQSDRQPPSADR